MKIRVKIPEEIVGHQIHNLEMMQRYVDEILLWGMETDMDIDFYCYFTPLDERGKWNSRERWAVFTVEQDTAFMFSLKWGALCHKGKA